MIPMLEEFSTYKYLWKFSLCGRSSRLQLGNSTQVLGVGSQHLTLQPVLANWEMSDLINSQCGNVLALNFMHRFCS